MQSPIKSPSQLFTNVERGILNIIDNKQNKTRVCRVQRIVNNKRTARGNTIPYFIPTVQQNYSNNNHVILALKTDIVNIWIKLKIQTYIQIQKDTWFFIKKAKINTEKKTVSTTNGVSNWMSTCRIIQLDLYFSPCIRLKSSWFNDFNI